MPVSQIALTLADPERPLFRCRDQSRRLVAWGRVLLEATFTRMTWMTVRVTLSLERVVVCGSVGHLSWDSWTLP